MIESLPARTLHTWEQQHLLGAVIKAQARWRGILTRRKVHSRKQSKREQKAAAIIQKNYRNYRKNQDKKAKGRISLKELRITSYVTIPPER